MVKITAVLGALFIILSSYSVRTCKPYTVKLSQINSNL